MICQNIITRDSMLNYINTTFINIDDFYSLSFILNSFSDSTIHEKLFYLLYNEIIGYDSIIFLKTNAKNNNWDFDQLNTDEAKSHANSVINNIIDQNKNYFIQPYSHIPMLFVRDFIIELSLFKYKDIKNIQDQINIINAGLSLEEQTFLSSYNLSLNDFYRIKLQDNFIIHAEIEKNDKIHLISQILNGFKNTTEKPNEDEILISIFKKIRLGTIN